MTNVAVSSRPIFSRGDSFHALLKKLHQNERELHGVGLKGGFLSFLLSRIQKKESVPLFILTASSQRAKELFQDLSFYLKGEGAPPLLWPARQPKVFYLSPPAMESLHQRVEVLLHLLSSPQSCTVVVPIRGLLEKTIPKKEFESTLFEIEESGTLDREALEEKLSEFGYERTVTVREKGEYAVKGGIVDCFAIGSEYPIRIEWSGDQIASLRHFDPQTQRSLDTLKRFPLAVRTEFLWREQERERLKQKVKERADDTGFPKSERERLIEEIERPAFSPQLLNHLSSFYDSLETLFDYLPAKSQIVLEDPIALVRRLERVSREIDKNYQIFSESGILLPPPDAHFASPEAVEGGWNRFPRISIDKIELYEIDADSKNTVYFDTTDPKVLRRQIREDRKGGFAPLARQIREWRAERVRTIIVDWKEERLSLLAEFLKAYSVATRAVASPDWEKIVEEQSPQEALLIKGELSEGFFSADERIALLTEKEIFGAPRKIPSTRSTHKAFLNHFSQLKPGHPVVHLEHGVGLYEGLQHMTIDGVVNDFLLIRYANNDRLYLPIDRLRLLQRYIGGGDKTPKLDRLGGKQWAKTKRRVARSIQEIAKDLVELYAARQAIPGHAYSPRDSILREFEASFPYEETPDQERAIEEILADMERPRPTDRLLCGEVGYGKTEVALRAAFRAATDGRQVAFLVPTTILAQQHYRTFLDRLNTLPLRVEVLNRFVPKRRQKEILRDLAEGRVDLLIGTHRILQKDVVFRNLGMLIIDEEHRFGVRAKEKIKQMRRSIDVLAMTATPIPRTLQLSLIGARDLSVINTPPVGRQPIATYLVPNTDAVIQEALVKELARNGQIFFVHNRIDTLTDVANRLKSLVPRLRIGIAHGRLSALQMEKVVIDFIDRRIDCLVCTSIIGSGIDIPSANTILIDRAEQFGLSDLHQLRGRVGRRSEKGYAYLLVSPHSILTSEAERRLQAIQEMSTLGSSFQLALEDLDIRGAGHLLGETQSGHIATIGFELYQQMLEKALAEMKGETFEEEIEPEIQLKVPAYIPEESVPEVSERLSLYKRLSGISSEKEIEPTREELRDRLGPLPPPLENLIRIIGIKVGLRKLRIRRVEFNRNRISFLFDATTPLPPRKMIERLRHKKNDFRFVSGEKLILSTKNQIGIAIIEEVEKQLKEWLQLLEEGATD